MPIIPTDATIPILGALSGTLSILAFVPYIRDMLHGQTRPQRTSWAIWAVLSSVSLAALVAEGAQLSIAFTATQWAATVLIAGLSLRYGEGSAFARADLAALLAAGCGIVAWLRTDDPTWALLICVATGAAGGLLTVAKAHRRPWSETRATWALSVLGAALAVVVAHLERSGWETMVYPAYLGVLGAAITVAITLGRRPGRIAAA
ncbi:MAG: hypothetical protein ACU0BF_05700 [Paracoccaceae bacterium]